MATKSAAQRVAEAALLGQPPAQSGLFGTAALGAGVVRTGRPGRPKGRKNNKTLQAEAALDNLGDVMLRGTLKTAMGDPIDEARRMATKIWNLPPDTPPDHIVTREPEKTGDNGITIFRAVTLGEKIEEFAQKLIDDRKNARAIAMPFVKQKKPAQVDVTERHLVTIRQIHMDDDGLGDGRGDPAAKAKPVGKATTIDQPPEEDGL